VRKEIWLLSEHGDDARDNGYVFFCYMNKKHPEILSYYVADQKNKRDFLKVKKVGKVVQYKSIKHRILYLLADKIVTSHVGDSEPWDYKKIVRFRERYPFLFGKKKIIFLDHGVIEKDISATYAKRERPVDLFICSTLPEAQYVKKTLQYIESEISCTGLARFDNLLQYKTKKQIVLMPTWRQNFSLQGCTANPLRKKFLHSDYYKVYQSLIESCELNQLLERYDYKLLFYPHYEMQKYLDCFHYSSKRITFANKTNSSVQTILKESKILITDYSSVAFDFAYMNKPMLYYQFDAKNNHHYGKTYFEYERDGFGPVVYEEYSLLRELEKMLIANGRNESVYADRCDHTFLHHDADNCRRIYEAISRL